MPWNRLVLSRGPDRYRSEDREGRLIVERCAGAISAGEGVFHDGIRSACDGGKSALA